VSETASGPVLSVVVVIVSDTTGTEADPTHLVGCLEGLEQQVSPPAMEILVPYHARTTGIPALRERFPHVRLVQVEDLRRFTGKGGNREHHDELRARGLSLARGAIVALLEDHGRPDPYWCQRIVQAHEEDYVGVGGAIENGIDRPLNWAVYYCDFGKYQNPIPRGASSFASDANSSYKRSALESIRPVWEESFQETAVNKVLQDRGQRLALVPDIIVFQERHGLQLGSAVRERYVWGRSYAASRAQLVGASRRVVYLLLSPALPFLLFLRLTATVSKKQRLIGRFLLATPLVLCLLVSWSFGEFIGYLTGRPAS
jgi:hypothetical protein